jgi:hypothetical protein
VSQKTRGREMASQARVRVVGSWAKTPGAATGEEREAVARRGVLVVESMVFGSGGGVMVSKGASRAREEERVETMAAVCM